MTTTKQSQRDEALANLRASISPGETLCTVIRHVSRSGMARDISLVQVKSPTDQRHWSALAARVIGARCIRTWPSDSVRMTGCGSDMGFELVYALSSALFPDGFGCIGEGCPSNDHSNGDRDYTPHGAPLTDQDRQVPCPLCHKHDPRVHGDKHMHWHKDGGYALRQRWL